MKRPFIGKWNVHAEIGENDLTAFHAIKDENGIYVASTWNGPDIQVANLIAAAPDLLDALQATLKIAKDYWKSGEYSGSEDIKDWPEITQARAAIAKATGEQS